MNIYKFIAATIFTIFSPVLLHAQHIQEWTSEFAVRYGDYRDETFTIRVLVDMESNDYANAEFVLGCRAGGELLPAMIFLHGERELQSFYNELKAIRNKYSEWLSVAKANGVRNMVKDIPIQISSRELHYYNGQMTELKSVNTPLKALFRAEFSSLSLLPTNTIRIGFNSFEPEAIPIFHVRSVADLDKILNAVNIVKIKAKINAKQQKNNLFN